MINRRFSLILAGALVAGFALSPLSPADADPSGTALPLASVANIVADGTDGRVFVSGGSGTSGVVVTDLAGQITDVLADQTAVSDLLLREGSSLLYLARTDDGSISELDTASLIQTRTFTTGGCPESLAREGNRLWFTTSCGNKGWLGSVNLTTGSVTHYFNGVSAGLTDLAASDSNPNRLVTSTIGTVDDVTVLYDTSTNPPTEIARNDGRPNTTQISITPDGDSVLVAHGYATQSFSMVDMTGSPVLGIQPVSAIATTPAPPGMMAVGVQGTVWVYNNTYSMIRHWNLPAGDVIAREGVALTADGTSVFAVSTNSGTTTLHAFGDPAVFATQLAFQVAHTRLQVDDKTVLGGSLTYIDDQGFRQPISGQVQVTRKDGSGVRNLGMFKPDSTGWFLIPYTPKQRGTVSFTLTYAGSATHPAKTITSTGNIRGLDPHISLSASPATYKSPQKISIHVGGEIAHRQVTVYARSDGGRERVIGRPRVSPQGDASLTYRPTKSARLRVATQGDTRFDPTSRSLKSEIAPRLVATVGNAASHQGAHYRVPTRVNPVIKMKLAPKQAPKVRGVAEGEVLHNGHWQFFGSSKHIRLAHGRNCAVLYVGSRYAGQQFRFRWYSTPTSTTRVGHSNWVYVTFY